MMQSTDDREFWMGIGYMTAGIRFSVTVSKDRKSLNGFKVRRRIYWAKPLPTMSAMACVSKVLDIADMTFKPAWSSNDEVSRFMLMMERLSVLCNIKAAFADQSGMHVFSWVFDNPPPSDYETFVEWAGLFDSEVSASKMLDF